MLVPKVTETLINNTEILTDNHYEIDVNEFEEADFKYLYIDILDEDEKAIEDYVKMIEKIVRKSYEYNQYIYICKTEFDLNKCAFFKNINFEDLRKVGLEMHHYPLTLYDIVYIILMRRIKDSHDDPGNMEMYDKVLNPFDISKEVMRCHYEGLIGLVPMTITPHELYHQGKLFIPLTKDYVFGNYWDFIDRYEVKKIDNYKDKLQYIINKTNEILDGDIDLNLEKLTIKEVKVNMQEQNELKKLEKNQAEEIST